MFVCYWVFGCVKCHFTHLQFCGAIFQVPFEVLVRRRIARLLDPSLQCLSFVYDELIKVLLHTPHCTLLVVFYLWSIFIGMHDKN